MVASQLGLTVIVPTLAVDEVSTLRPGADQAMWQLTRHPQVLLARMDATRQAAIEALYADQPPADVTAAWVASLARERDWPVLSADSRRVHLLDPQLSL